MASVVNDACVKCKSCVDVCPVDAFHEGETMLRKKLSPQKMKLMKNGSNSTLRTPKTGLMQTNKFPLSDTKASLIRGLFL